MKKLIPLFLIAIATSCTSAPKEKVEPIVKEKPSSSEVLIHVNDKNGQEIGLKYLVKYFGKHDFSDTSNQINQTIQSNVISHLTSFGMYDMFASKRDSVQFFFQKEIEKQAAELSELNIQETALLEVIIPEKDAERYSELEKLRSEGLDELKKIKDKMIELEGKLLTDNLSESNRGEIESETWKLAIEHSELKDKMNEIIFD